jgi:hypothetical protein
MGAPGPALVLSVPEPADEAVAFLLTRSGSSDEHSAVAVAELLGWLPLALEQAGAYVRETRIALSAYLDRLRQFPALTLARGRPRDRVSTDTVATTWQVSLERVQPVPGAVALLEVCAFLGPVQVPRELFARPIDPPAEELTRLASDPFILDEAIAAARRFGLIKASEHTLVMHRLLQQVIRSQLASHSYRERAVAALRLITAAFPTDYASPDVWPVYARLLPHALAVAEHAEALAVEPEATAWLLNEAGQYLGQRADHQQARGLLERAVAIREARLGVDHPATATSLHNMADVLYAQGNLDGARALHERALAIHEASLGPADRVTAHSLQGLAYVLRDQGDLRTARKLLERALAIDETRKVQITWTPPIAFTASPTCCTLRVTSTVPAPSTSAP